MRCDRWAKWRLRTTWRHDRRPGGDIGFVRGSEATVAGRVFIEWQTLDLEAHPAVVCITNDGVLLRAGTADQVR